MAHGVYLIFLFVKNLQNICAHILSSLTVAIQRFQLVTHRGMQG